MSCTVKVTYIFYSQFWILCLLWKFHIVCAYKLWTKNNPILRVIKKTSESLQKKKVNFWPCSTVWISSNARRYQAKTFARLFSEWPAELKQSMNQRSLQTKNRLHPTMWKSCPIRVLRGWWGQNLAIVAKFDLGEIYFNFFVLRLVSHFFLLPNFFQPDTWIASKMVTV
jgi:hypothetical protein